MARTRSKGAVASPKASKVTKPSPKATKTKAAAKPKSKPSPKTKSSPEPVQDLSPVPEKVSDKAISELKKYIIRQKEEESNKSDKKLQLFEEDPEDAATLYLTIDSKKFFSPKPEFKPKTIKVTKSIHTPNVTTCLILRDELIKSDELLESLENDNELNITQIVPMQIIKTEYKNFEKRREFHAKYDVFLVDDAVLNIMPNALGKIFYESTKYPIPVRVTTSKNTKELSLVTLKNQVNKALSSTSYLPPTGHNVSVKIGTIDFDTKDLISNINDVVASLDINGIKSIHLKTRASPSLPLFYTDKLYNDEDVAKEEGEEEEKPESKKEQSAFERILLGLGDAETVAKVVGKKSKNSEGKKPSKGKVTKPKK
ncbi:SPAC8F11.04 putative ribosome biogenesis protein C8F11.04 [Candida maltosa Xu316]